jgi:uncharacterized protein
LKVVLDPLEQRVLGSLIEKEVTTPDQYPLSLNALMLACNQKTNRDPMMELDEASVQAIVDRLQKKHLVFERSGFGSRVPKYQQRLCGTEFSELKLSPQQRALTCVLLLRGPQTLAELRTRTHRLAEFGDVSDVEQALQSMASRAEGALVVLLARAPGEREARYQHLLGDAPPGTETNRGVVGAASRSPSPRDPDPAQAATAAHHPPDDAATRIAESIAELRSDVAALRAEVAALRARLGE